MALLPEAHPLVKEPTSRARPPAAEILGSIGFRFPYNAHHDAARPAQGCVREGSHSATCGTTMTSAIVATMTSAKGMVAGTAVTTGILPILAASSRQRP